MHYELANLTAERIDLHNHDFDGKEEEVPLTFALAASWFSSDGEVELMVEINEADQEWSYEECQKLSAAIMTAVSAKFPAVNDSDRTDHADNGFGEEEEETDTIIESDADMDPDMDPDADAYTVDDQEDY